MPQSSIGVNWKVWGAAVRCERERLGLSQRALADQITGMSSPTICRAEQGKEMPVGPYLAICQHMDIHPFEIINIGNVSIADLQSDNRVAGHA